MALPQYNDDPYLSLYYQQMEDQQQGLGQPVIDQGGPVPEAPAPEPEAEASTSPVAQASIRQVLCR